MAEEDPDEQTQYGGGEGESVERDLETDETEESEESADEVEESEESTDEE